MSASIQNSFRRTCGEHRRLDEIQRVGAFLFADDWRLPGRCLPAGRVGREAVSLMYRKPSTFPKDGRKVLAYIDFGDQYAPPGWCVVRWREDASGFNLQYGEDGGGWHRRGLIAWTELPKAPRVKK